MIKVLSVFGTRPEAIKMSPLCLKLNDDKRFQHKLCVTGQHREMLDQVLNLFEIIPDYDLNIMSKSQSLVEVSSRILKGLEKIFDDFQPNVLLVHGDTATTFSASLAAYYNRIPVAHVEAGLRTKNIYLPWPEEGNRVLTSIISKHHFAPTHSAYTNLVSEGISKNDISVTGNTVIDALFMILRRIEEDRELSDSLYTDFPEVDFNKKIILVTCHRRETFGDSLNEVCQAIKELALMYPDFQIVYPVHLNPNIYKPVMKILGNIKNIFLVKPLDYLPFIFLMSKSYLVLTDSGGIQEEAPSLGKPVLLMRDTTERPEAVEAGTVVMIGTKREKIVSSVTELITNSKKYKNMSLSHNPYGDGEACNRIIKRLFEIFK